MEGRESSGVMLGRLYADNQSGKLSLSRMLLIQGVCLLSPGWKTATDFGLLESLYETGYFFCVMLNVTEVDTLLVDAVDLYK